MLVLILSAAPQFDAGSISLCLARALAVQAESVLTIDSDTNVHADGTLAARLGATQHRNYEPHKRGLPSLMASRRPLTTQLLAEHAYQIEGTNDQGMLLLGPENPRGRLHAVSWMAEHRAELLRIADRGSVLLTASLADSSNGGGPWYSDWLGVANVLIMLVSDPPHGEFASAGDTILKKTAQLGRQLGRHASRRMLVASERIKYGDGKLIEMFGCEAVGRLPEWDDTRILRDANRHRGHRIGDRLGSIAKSLVTLDEGG